MHECVHNSTGKGTMDEKSKFDAGILISSNAELPEFAQLLMDLRQGTAIMEWADDLEKICAAVASTGEPGELQITLKIESLSGDGSMISIFDKTKVKTPRPKHGATTYELDTAGRVIVRHPEQIEMPGVN